MDLADFAMVVSQAILSDPIAPQGYGADGYLTSVEMSVIFCTGNEEAFW
jgi:hypothetical protein